MKGRLGLLLAAFIGLVAAVTLVDFYQWAALPDELLIGARWTGLAGLLAFGLVRRKLTYFIFVGMLIGLVLGVDVPEVAVELQVLSKIFLQLIKSIIAPLLFATLVVGIAGHSNLQQVGRMGWKSLLYFEIVTTIALFIGLAAINLSKAGVGIDLTKMGAHEAIALPPKQDFKAILLHIFPENIAKSIAEGQVLQIVVFSVLFGIALAMTPERTRRTMLNFTESLAETMFKYTKLVMYFVPIGVGAAMAYTVGKMGLGVLENLFMLLGTLYVALIVFVLGVLLPVALIARVPLRRFVKAIAEPVSIAFATTSSEAALPRAMEAMEKLGVPRKIVAFVMPTGYSFNLDGTTLYLALAAVFVMQAAGQDFSIGHQIVMMFTLMLTSKGVAGVPRASLVILLGTVASFDLPVEPVYLILGIDELMDMARTAVNVTGNCLATVVVARWEGEFDPDAVVVEA